MLQYAESELKKKGATINTHQIKDLMLSSGMWQWPSNINQMTAPGLIHILNISGVWLLFSYILD